MKEGGSERGKEGRRKKREGKEGFRTKYLIFKSEIFSNNFAHINLFSNFSQNMSLSESPWCCKITLTNASLFYFPERHVRSGFSYLHIMRRVFWKAAHPPDATQIDATYWCSQYVILSFLRIRDKKPVGAPLRKSSHIWLPFLSPSLSSSSN